MPGWRRKQKTWPDPEDYVRAVKEQKATDPVIRFHIRAGFEPIGVLRNYLPDDADSGRVAHHRASALGPDDKGGAHL